MKFDINTPVPFIHLRNHTIYSVAEGMIGVDSMVDLCKKYEMPAVGITDTNNIFGGAKFSNYLTDNGIQTIFGTQIDVDFGLPSSILSPFCEVVLLVQNDEGYKNLIKLLSIAHVDKLDKDPVKITFDTLSENNAGLIFLSGGVRGVLGKCILYNNYDLADEYVKKIKDVFGDRFYIEIQRHNLPDEQNTEKSFLKLAKDNSVGIVATNENYFSEKEMFFAHEVLLCIKEGVVYGQAGRRRETDQHYFKSSDEMKELFKDLPEALFNTFIIALRCSYLFKSSKPLLPHVEKGADEDAMLRQKSLSGLENRLKEIGVNNDTDRKSYFDRLEYELSVIIKMGFSGYFLIVSDFIGWAKNQNIPVGPGRGSGAGSVVAWSLKITNLDPLKFGLLFERFLNPERVNMPDFDIDFCEERRAEVIHYVKQKYGDDSVGQIITFGKIKAKNAIKDVGRVLGVSYTRCDNLCKLIPKKISIVKDGKEVEVKSDSMTVSMCMKYLPDFSMEVDQDEDLQQVIRIAIQVEGVFKNTGMHAAGVVIGDRPIRELVALYKTEESDLPVVQYDMKYIESTGLIKYDFLGLKTLTIIQKACDLIYKTHGIKINIDNIPLDDKKVFELLTSGNTSAVFQLESGGMRATILSLKPDKIDDLVALVALFRPGPMDNIPLYIRRKFGEKVEYLHPKMEPILKDTYGIMVYQEQVMEMGKQLAGYSLGAADVLRRAMGKKDPVAMAKHRDIFTDGCLKYSSIDKETSTKIFDAIEQFANYGFNKSHAVCYALIGYQTAYLKTHYTAEFMAATMTMNLDNTDKLVYFAENVKSMGIKILSPDINKSFEYFSVENGNIRYSLSAIKGLGVSLVKEIADEREKNGDFINITDFITRLNSKLINKRMMESLIKAGAFDKLEPNRNKLFENIPYIISYSSSCAEDENNNQTSLFSMDEINVKRDDFVLAEAVDWSPFVKLNYEKEVIGFYVSAHPLDIYEMMLSSIGVLKISDINGMKQDGKVKFAGVIENVKKRVSKNGKNYVQATVSDKTGTIDVMFFERSSNSQNINPYALKYRKESMEEIQSLDRIFEILNLNKPVLIYSDVKFNSADNKVSLFGNRCEELTFDTKFSGDLFIDVLDSSAVSALKKAFDVIPEGLTNIHLNIKECGKEISIKLFDRKTITLEIMEILKSVSGIKIRFS